MDHMIDWILFLVQKGQYCQKKKAITARNLRIGPSLPLKSMTKKNPALPAHAEAQFF
jgi:hypothetical protein